MSNQPDTKPRPKRGRPPKSCKSTNLNSNLSLKKTCLLRFKLNELRECKKRYRQNLTELNFLQGGNPLINYYTWRNHTPDGVAQVLQSGSLDNDDEKEIAEFLSGKISALDFYPALPDQDLPEFTVLSLPQQRCGTNNSQLLQAEDEEEDDDDEAEITRKALEEVNVLCRIAELKKAKMWSEDADTRVQEPSRRPMFYMDNHFAEMQWLADDFLKERHWKKVAAKKLAYAAVKSIKEREEKSKKLAKEEIVRVRKLAAQVSKMIRDWWRQMNKIVQAKHEMRLVAKRQQAISTHLGKIVETTERYTEWLTEGLQSTNSAQEDNLIDDDENEADFVPPDSSEDDDEETIDKDERAMSEWDTCAEVEALKAESEMPIEDLLKSIEEARLKAAQEDEENGAANGEETNKSCGDDDDKEFSASEDSEDDEETLEEQERHEKKLTEDYRTECTALEDEANMSLEELMKKYNVPVGNGGDPPDDEEEKVAPSESGSKTIDDKSVSSSDENEDDSDDSDDESEKESSDDDSVCSNDEDEFTMADLFKAKSTKNNDTANEKTDNVDGNKDGDSEQQVKCKVSEFQGEAEFNELTKEAMSAQPRGFTLETQRVNVKVPFLIKHSLREYQHVGLDWLAAIYEKRLNGILADEMGLGKTIQTIALLAYLACEREIWGPHLIVVPTSVMLNWEMEFKKWCPAFKILTYYGSLKERREKRKGWTKTNAFHVCITSYKLAIQDQAAFKRKKWKYLILDEAQNIKNFKSQRWQTLLTFNSQRRLLLTGTPLQNTLMELWSLMHFLMPNIFQSHREFQEWFASPLTGMIEGNNEYNEQLVRRLHKVLRPFILRRLKKDVEKQMPKKFEHVVMCRLSRRQRFLYDDFMSQTDTRDTLASGHFLSVINILMQLRKVCNHPNLLEARPILSSFQTEGLEHPVPRILFCARGMAGDEHTSMLDHALNDDFNPAHAFMRCFAQSCSLADMAHDLPSFVATRIMGLSIKSNLIQEVDSTRVVATSVDDDHLLSELPRTFLPRGVLQELYEEYNRKLQTPVDPSEESPSKISRVPLPYPKLITGPSSSQQYEHYYQDAGEDLPSELQQKRYKNRQERLALMGRINERRCSAKPLYASDLINFLQKFFLGLSTSRIPFTFNQTRKNLCHKIVNTPAQSSTPESKLVVNTFRSGGYIHCINSVLQPHNSSTLLNEAVLSVERRIQSLDAVIQRFVVHVPPVSSPAVRVATSSYNFYRQQELLHRDITAALPQNAFHLLHPILGRQNVQFPETRLIQYDCGKLQTLEVLLRDLKSGSHRVLIFTQMTRMLDILEHFLSYHGHRYLRLDGATKVEQRQILMERFNQDPKIFAFILSTRSGGLGVNLTGADTVIFYDSDWNPTMDAQAQDRCHRIGQTRDVHIYRLISERTIEENILKKANQKRFLSDVAIEGGQFTTAFFKKGTLNDLFEEPSGLDELAREKNAESCQSDAETSADNAVLFKKPDSGSAEVSENAFEAALETFEEETDRVAASKAKAEAKAELAEFDESIPWTEDTNEGKLANKNSNNQSNLNGSEIPESDHEEKTERELREFQRQLRPIERFGVDCLESIWGPALMEQLEQADLQMENSKQQWELDQLKALREEEELLAAVGDDEMFYCYGGYDPAEQRKQLEKLKKIEKAELAELEAEERARKEEQARRKALIEQQRRRHLLAVAAQKKVKVATGQKKVKKMNESSPKSLKRKMAPQIRFEIPNSTIDPSAVASSDLETPSPSPSKKPRKANPAAPHQKQLVLVGDTPVDASSPSRMKSLPPPPQPAAAGPSRLPIPRLTAPPVRVSRAAPMFNSAAPVSNVSYTNQPTFHQHVSLPYQPFFVSGRAALPSLRPMSASSILYNTNTAGVLPAVPPTTMQQRLILPQPVGERFAIPSSPVTMPSHQTTPIVRQAPPAHNNISILRPSSSSVSRAIPPLQHQSSTANIRNALRMAEPQFQVQTTNGIRSMMPASQLILNGQPVLFITRQTKTASGEIIEQRFTQPIQTTPQYMQVVQRLQRNGTSAPPTLTPSPVIRPQQPVLAPRVITPKLNAPTPVAAPQIRPRQVTSSASVIRPSGSPSHAQTPVIMSTSAPQTLILNVGPAQRPQQIHVIQSSTNHSNFKS